MVFPTPWGGPPPKPQWFQVSGLFCGFEVGKGKLGEVDGMKKKSHPAVHCPGASSIGHVSIS